MENLTYDVIGNRVCDWRMFLNETCPYYKTLRIIMYFNLALVTCGFVSCTFFLFFRWKYMNKRVFKREDRSNCCFVFNTMELLYVGGSVYHAIRIPQLCILLYAPQASIGWNSLLLEFAYTFGYFCVLYFAVSMMEGVPKTFVKHQIENYQKIVKIIVQFFFAMSTLVYIMPWVLFAASYVLPFNPELSERLETSFYAIWVSYMIVTTIIIFVCSRKLILLLEESRDLAANLPGKKQKFIERIEVVLRDVKLSSIMGILLNFAVIPPIFCLAAFRSYIWEVPGVCITLCILYEVCPSLLVIFHNIFMAIKDYKSFQISGETPQQSHDEDSYIDEFRRSAATFEVEKV